MIGANNNGVVAVAYLDWWSANPYVRVSTDHGANWTDPVRVDTGVAENTHWARDLDASGGRQRHHPRGLVPGSNLRRHNLATASNAQIYYARSTNAGLTFEVEKSLGPLSAGWPTAELPPSQLSRLRRTAACSSPCGIPTRAIGSMLYVPPTADVTFSQHVGSIP